ncbi:integrase domain-containing protein [Halodesulfovibrio sp.]|jgi:integrase|uniref:integrase domain-containing protein n=1 Tax=Halodesulfovibrio sp. TaxID=1912772 RepID=UPI0025FE5CCD|nr:integrase domain-containing protein [Halodesulfovibrio sp.]MCT4535178.1 integrase domain-containing protein [Halodesulfovibrio sp.]
MSKNKLLYGIKNAKLTGSRKTQYTNKAQAMRFAKLLFKLGYRPQHWKNITNKHVGVVVDEWKRQGKETSTIKAYVGSIRSLAKAYGNVSLHKLNSAFGIGRRSTIPKRSRAVPYKIYQEVKDHLLAGSERHKRIGHQLIVMNELGLRPEEARKINPDIALLPDERIYVSAGTKGGRDRIIHDPTKEQVEAVKALAPYIGQYGNSIPDTTSEANWEKYVYKVVSTLGLSIAACGASLHGLRHAFAHRRYHELTNLDAPCLHCNPETFRQAAYDEHGPQWRKVHDRAVVILAHELGHNRGEVTASYLGSIHG